MLSREKRDFEKVLDSYYEQDTEKKALEKELESKKSFIKLKLKEMECDNYETENCKAIVSYQNRVSMDDEKVIEIIKQNIPEDKRNNVIKTKEYVDYEILEGLIYNGDIPAQKLEPAQTVKTIVQLKVTKNTRKDKEND